MPARMSDNVVGAAKRKANLKIKMLKKKKEEEEEQQQQQNRVRMDNLKLKMLKNASVSC